VGRGGGSRLRSSAGRVVRFGIGAVVGAEGL